MAAGGGTSARRGCSRSLAMRGFGGGLRRPRLRRQPARPRQQLAPPQLRRPRSRASYAATAAVTVLDASRTSWVRARTDFTGIDDESPQLGDVLVQCAGVDLADGVILDRARDRDVERRVEIGVPLDRRSDECAEGQRRRVVSTALAVLRRRFRLRRGGLRRL